MPLKLEQESESQICSVSSECCGTVEGVMTGDRHVCIFNHVYPDGDVHWFHGSLNLTGRSLHYTTKHSDRLGWWTIRGYLEQKSGDEPFNCSLMSTSSGRYIASTLVLNTTSPRASSGVGSLRSIRIFSYVSVLFAVKMNNAFTNLSPHLAV